MQSEASEDNISNVEDNSVTEEPIEVSDDAVTSDNEVPLEAPQENNSEAVDQNEELSAENCDERLSCSDDSKICNKENECVERDQLGAYDLDDSCETTSDCALNLECVDNTCQNEGEQ